MAVLSRGVIDVPCAGITQRPRGGVGLIRSPATPMNRPYAPLLGIVLALIGVAAAIGLPATSLDASLDAFLAGDQRTRAGIDRINQLIDERTVVAVLVEMDDLFSDDGAGFVADLSLTLRRIPGVRDVNSLTHSYRPVRKGFSFSISEMIELEPFIPRRASDAEAWREIEKRVLEYPWARDVFVSADARWTMLVMDIVRPLPDVEAKRLLADEIDTVLAEFADRTPTIHVVALPFIELEVREGLLADTKRFGLAASVLIVVILLVTFRSLAVLVLVLLFEALGAFLVALALHLLDVPLTLYTGMLFPLVGGLQLTFLTHYFSAFQRALTHTSVAEARALALRDVLWPSTMAALTTLIGLGSLIACDVATIRQLAEVGALAVALVFAVTFAPALILARGRVGGATHHTVAPSTSLGTRVAELLRPPARRRAAIITAVVFVGICLVGATKLRTDVRAVEHLDPAGRSAQAFGVLDAELGGIGIFQLEIDTQKPGGVGTPEALRFMEDLRGFAEELPGVTHVYTYSQIYCLLNELWEQGKPGSHRLPENPMLLRTMSIAIAALPLQMLDAVRSPDGRTASAYVRTRDMPGADYLAVIEELLAGAEARVPPGIELRAESGLHDLLDADRRIVASLTRSVVTCFFAVFIALWLLWRSARLALLTLVTNVVPLAATVGLMGYAGLPLNSITVMVAALMLGIAVDDSIHFLSHYRSLEREGEVDHAASRALADKLAPMACTTAVLVTLLGLFVLSRFPPVADFGALMGVSLICALASAAFVLPSLIWDRT